MAGVIYHGIVPNPDLRVALRKMHFLVYPSTFPETSCVAVMDAMAAGCRVIVPSLARRRNPDTYRNDAGVLLQALLVEKDPFLISRYTFYLAQSFRDCGDRENAVDAHLKRADSAFGTKLHAGNRLCRLNNDFTQGYALAKQGLAVSPPGAGLFVEQWIYDYGLLGELAVYAYWVVSTHASASCGRESAQQVSGPG